jgi:hypothetical protein
MNGAALQPGVGQHDFVRSECPQDDCPCFVKVNTYPSQTKVHPLSHHVIGFIITTLLNEGIPCPDKAG